MTSRRQFIAALPLIVALTAAGVSGCTPGTVITGTPTPTGPRTSSLSAVEVDPGLVIDAAAELLSCDRTERRDGDPYNIARGDLLTCLERDGSITNVFSFEHERGMRISLNDAGFGPGDELLLGSTWYAIGPPEDLADLARLDGAAPSPSSSRPPEVVLSDIEDELTTCIRFTSGGMSTSMTNPSQYERDAPMLEELYPGLETFVATTLDDDDRDRFADADDGDVDLQTELASHQAAVRTFCETFEPTGAPGS